MTCKNIKKAQKSMMKSRSQKSFLFKSSAQFQRSLFSSQKRSSSPKSGPKMPNQPKYAYLADNPDFGQNAGCIKEIHMK